MFKRDYLIWILTLASFLTLMGCQKKNNNSVPISPAEARGMRVDGGNHSAVPNSGIGIIGADGTYWQDFQNAMGALVSATMDPNALGEVSPVAGDPTGVRFWGQINLDLGPLDVVDMPQTSVLPNSWLEIVIWDSYAGTPNEDGEILPEIRISFPRAQGGFVVHDYAELYFEDEYGQIVLEGRFDASYFEGTLHFSNRVAWDGGPAGEGTLSFSIPTCEFFRCQ